MNLITLLERVESRMGSLANTPILDDLDGAGPEIWQYVVMWPDGGNPSSSALDQRVDLLEWGLTIMCVGRSRAACLDAVQQVRSALIGWDPAPESAASGCFYEEETRPPMNKQSVEGDTRFSITCTYRLITERS